MINYLYHNTFFTLRQRIFKLFWNNISWTSYIKPNADTFKESNKTVRYKNVESEEIKKSIPQSFSDDVITSFSAVHIYILNTQIFIYIHTFINTISRSTLNPWITSVSFHRGACCEPPGGKCFLSEMTVFFCRMSRLSAYLCHCVELFVLKLYTAMQHALFFECGALKREVNCSSNFGIIKLMDRCEGFKFFYIFF